MFSLRYMIVGVLCLSLVTPTQSNWFKRTLSKVVDAGKKIVNKVKQTGCKLLYGIACPETVKLLGKAVSSVMSKKNDLIVGFAVAAGKNECHVRRKRCKRNAAEIMFPFSDELSDYDINGNKEISYNEFVITVMSSVNLADPDELMEPFIFADADGNGLLDTQEFIAAPFLFAHVDKRPDIGGYKQILV